MSVASAWVLGDACPAPLSQTETRVARNSTRLAAVVFAIGCVLGALLLFAVLGAGMWFALDEWQFLVHRDASNIGDLFADHNGHWSTAPILLYRALYHLVGLRSYLPYQLLVVGAHIGLLVVLRALLRQAGVSPWIATAVPLSFLLFGTGAQNIVWAFQVGFVGGITLALTQLLLANHDGPIGRRDGAAVATGCVALTFAGTAVPIIAMTTAAVLIRRGWRAALLQAAPPAALFLMWSALANDAPSLRSSAAMVRGAFDFVRQGIPAAFLGLGGNSTAVATLLAALLVTGTFLVIYQRRYDRKGLLRLAPIGVLALGAVAAIAVIGTERWLLSGPEGGTKSRYVYMSAALLLAPLGVAADALVRRWLPALVPVLAVFSAGIPHNIASFATVGGLPVETYEQRAPLVVALAHHPLLEKVPPDARPYTPTLPGLTAAWLRETRDSGRLPKIEGLPWVAAVRLRFGLSALPPETVPASLLRATADCPLFHGSTQVTLQPGDLLQFDGRSHGAGAGVIEIQEIYKGKYRGPPLSYSPFGGTVLRAELPELRVEIRVIGAGQVRLCLPGAIFDGSPGA